MNGGTGRNKTRRAYQPGVENLETLRLLSGMVADLLAPAATEILPVSPTSSTPIAAPASDEAWDLALDQALEASSLLDIDLDAGVGVGAGADPDIAGATDDFFELDGQASSLAVASVALERSGDNVETDSTLAGLSQISRYLSRAWARAGIPEQKRDDCSQAVFVQMLQTLGRSQFDVLMEGIDQFGVRAVLHRDSTWGPDFFRSVDAVKKRAQRERPLQPLDNAEWVSKGGDAQTLWVSDWREALNEAISASLNPREAALIQATINGETPAEIAARWGIAPKTVSNEKTKALQKLRDVLIDSMH